MLNNIFTSIITMSIAAGICIIFFFALRIITKRLFSSTWHYYIWLAVVCVLIIPFKLDTPSISKINFNFIQLETIGEVSFDTNENDSDLFEQHIGATSSNNGGTNIRAAVIPLIQKLPVIWLCGVILSIIYRMTIYFKFALSVKRMARVCSDEFTPDFFPCKFVKIKKSTIKTPFLMGLFKPVIYLPDIEWNSSELEMVLTHEVTHLKRKDILYKMLMQAVLCIHWFNPLVYLMNRDMQKNCELSCDEKAISRMDGERRKIYMKTILNLIGRNSLVQTNMTTAMGASKSETEKRIRSMIKYKNHSRLIKYISVAAAVILFTTGVVTASQINIVNAAIPTNMKNIINSADIDEIQNDTIKNDSFYNIAEETITKFDEPESFKKFQTEIEQLYKEFGLIINSDGSMYYQDHPVRLMYDSVTYVFMAENLNPHRTEDTIDIIPVYNGEVLTGLRIATQEEYDAITALLGG